MSQTPSSYGSGLQELATSNDAGAPAQKVNAVKVNLALSQSIKKLLQTYEELRICQGLLLV